MRGLIDPCAQGPPVLCPARAGGQDCRRCSIYSPPLQDSPPTTTTSISFVYKALMVTSSLACNVDMPFQFFLPLK